MNIGINALRAKSGGAKSHLLGILSKLDPLNHGILQVHVWSYKTMLNMLPDKPWLIKHCPFESDESIIRQLIWERFTLPKLMKENDCEILLNLDASTICRFQPSVTMSRDMLSYEKGEIERYGFGLSRLRLIVIKYLQNLSFRTAQGVIFLTAYASEAIQKSSGKLNFVRIIPHGVDEKFSNINRFGISKLKVNDTLDCLYVSNVAPYKHQWHVIHAISILRRQGINVKLTLTGGGNAGSSSVANYKLGKALKDFDPDGQFVSVLGYIDHSTLPSLLSKSDIFIFASSCENMPNTLLEAMAVGLPIACSNRGPMPEILESAGVYFNPEDSISIFNAVKYLVRNPIERDNFALKAKSISTHYSWKRCSAETFSFLMDTFTNYKIMTKS